MRGGGSLDVIRHYREGKVSPWDKRLIIEKM